MILRPEPKQLTKRQNRANEPSQERIEILEVFAGLPDRRRKKGKRHQGNLCLALSKKSGPHRAIMLVSAYIVERGLILPTQVVESKTNEIKALPELIKLLALKGVVFAFDAINTQKKLAS
jgi:hypothetical protein